MNPMDFGVMMSKFWTKIPRCFSLDNKKNGIWGWVDGLEREEPLLIRSLSGLSTATAKAACIQAMHKHNPINVPISASELWLTKLIN